MKAPVNKIIFAIGGGELEYYETLPIDKMIVSAAVRTRKIKRGKVKALFIPTASGGDPDYCEAFEKIYGYMLGCQTDYLLLYGKQRSKASVRRQIDRCDFVYVGGGSTPAMMRMWRMYEVDKCLRRAWKSGKIMAGLSAGANCWFKWSLSDAHHGRWSNVSGLGFLDMACTPHYSNQRGRKKAFDKLVKKKKLTGIALDDNVCVKIVDDRYEVIKSDGDAEAYLVYDDSRKVRREVMEDKGDLSRVNPSDIGIMV